MLFATPTPTPTPVPTLAPTLLPTPSPAVTVVVAGAGQHDTFDWLASVVIPAFTGLATLAVSVLSLFIALTALRLSVRAAATDAEQRSETLRKERVDVSTLAQKWFMGEVLRKQDLRTTSDVRAKQAADGVDLNKRLDLLPDGTGKNLRNALMTLVRNVTPENADATITEGFLLIIKWQDEPAAADEEYRRRIRIEALRRFFEDRQSTTSDPQAGSLGSTAATPEPPSPAR